MTVTRPGPTFGRLVTVAVTERPSVAGGPGQNSQGRTTARLRTADTTPPEIAREMVGRDVVLATEMRQDAAMAGEGWAVARDGESVAPASDARSLGTSSFPLPALEVRALAVGNARRTRAVDDVSFSISPGEILGVAGVEGNGQTELIEAIAGLRQVRSGSILLDHRDITHTAVRARGQAGLSHIPEDRHARGLVLDYSIAENLILGQQHRFARGGFLNPLDGDRIADNARRQIAAFDIRPNDPTLPARALSGGNQQKIVVAREMGRDFRVLLAAQPTRGVDVGAIEFIHAQLRGARDAGKAILLVSADLAEILALSDRVAVMYGGRFVVVLPRAQTSESVLGPYMTGAEQAA